MRIHRSLGGPNDVDTILRLHLGKKSLTDLADPVVVGEGSAVIEHGLPNALLDVVVYPDRVLQAFAAEAHGEIEADPGVIGLRHPVGEIGCAAHLVSLTLFDQRRLGGLADLVYPVPGHRGLESFAHEVELVEEISNVGYAEGERVAAFAVLATAADGSVILRQGEDNPLLMGDFAPGTLHHDGAGGDLHRIESLDLQQVELLHAGEYSPDRSGRRLERLTKTKLEVVDQSNARRQNAAAAQLASPPLCAPVACGS